SIDKSETQDSAKLAVEQILNDFKHKPAMSKLKIRQYLNQAHEKLKDESKNIRLKVSLVMLVTDYSKIIWAVTGNLRLYHFRGGAFNFRSKDLSIAQLMIDSGNLTEDEVNKREERNNILGFMGSSTDFVPSISEIYRLQDGDSILLCNIGLWENFKNSELTAALETAAQPDRFLIKLQQDLLDKKPKGLKNYTAGAISFRRVFQENSFSVQETACELLKEKNVLGMLRGIVEKHFNLATQDYRKLVQKAVWVVLPLLVLITAGIFVNKHVEAVKLQKELEHKKQIDLLQKQSINRHEANGNHWVSAAKYPQAVTEYQKALQVLSSCKDPQKEQTIRTKRDISKLIITADKYVSDGNYSEALQLYSSAVQKGETANYDLAGLNERITRTKQIIDMFDLVKNGDDEYARQNFQVSREKYQLALSIAEQLSQEDLKVALSRKIGNVEHNIAVIEEKKAAQELARQREVRELDRRQKVKEIAVKSTPKTTKEPKLSKAAQLELAGDNKFNAGLYKESIELYRLAKTAYEERGMYQEASDINIKIKKAKRMRIKSFF
ncbi:MAG TPA: hypothetical protein VEC37_04165, partial [Bacillota bacterium]|nr:hypothetical protein [Bacillota bacterium]